MRRQAAWKVTGFEKSVTGTARLAKSSAVLLKADCAVENEARSSRVRKPAAVVLSPIVVVTTESSGLRSCARPLGFHEAAVPSSDTAMKAFAMPAARAPEPGRLKNTPTWAEAGAAAHARTAATRVVRA